MSNGPFMLRSMLSVAALGAASTAGAESPSLLWSGVVRIAVVCPSQGSASKPSALHARACAEVARQLGARTRYPVAIVDLADVDPFEDLKLDVETLPASGRGQFGLSVRAGRLGNRSDQSKALAVVEVGPVSQLATIVEKALAHVFPS